MLFVLLTSPLVQRCSNDDSQQGVRGQELSRKSLSNLQTVLSESNETWRPRKMPGYRREVMRPVCLGRYYVNGGLARVAPHPLAAVVLRRWKKFSYLEPSRCGLDEVLAE